MSLLRIRKGGNERWEVIIQLIIIGVSLILTLPFYISMSLFGSQSWDGQRASILGFIVFAAIWSLFLGIGAGVLGLIVAFILRYPNKLYFFWRCFSIAVLSQLFVGIIISVLITYWVPVI